jgi:voltage-gated potassium channel
VTLGRILMILAGFFAFAVAGFTVLERLSLGNAVYLAVATMTTVGYGDVVPGTVAGRWFSVLVMLGGVSIGFYAVGSLAALLVEGRVGRLVEERRMRKQIEALENHFVICGYGEVGVRLVAELVKSDADFVVVERDPARAQAARDEGCPVVEGDATDDAVLAQARVERARGLATVINDDAENLYITASTRALNPSIPIVARGSRRRGGRYLTQAGATGVVYLDDLGAIRVARSLMHPDVVTFLEEMMSPARGDAQLEAMKLPPGCPAAGRTLKELNLRARLGIQILAVKRDGRYLANPAPEEKLIGEDVLLVVGAREQIDRLESELDREGS